MIIPAHKDKMTKFFENQSKLITFSKKIQKESQKKAKNLKKPKNISMGNQQKKSRILYEKVVLKKKRSHIKKQYDVTDCYIDKCIKESQKEEIKTGGRRKILKDEHLKYIKALIDDKNYSSIQLKNIKHLLLKKFPQIPDISANPIPLP